MSHFTRVRTRLRDADTLLEALETVGFGDVEVHEQAQPLYGYQGDVRPERAEIIVRRAHIGRLSNDIGFVRQHDGSFEAIVSDYDRSRFGTAWLAELTRAYSHAATLRYADSHGYEVATDEVQQDGTRRLTLRRPA
jgi:Protein of unknown function (DUF1257)